MTVRDTDKDWQAVAESEPYWAVLSVDLFRGGKLTKAQLDTFFETGEHDVRGVLNVARTFLDQNFKIERALDFGCGVGRLAIPIARQASAETVGVDVSPEMLRLCAQNARDRGVLNLTLVEGDDALSKVDGAFNFINTYLVLQHIPPQRGLAIVDQLLKRLAPGGVAALQMTYAKARRFMRHDEWRSSYYRRDGDTVTELALNPDQRPEGSITMYDYDLNQIFALIQRVTRGYVSVRPTNDDDHLGVHIVLKRDL